MLSLLFVGFLAFCGGAFARTSYQSNQYVDTVLNNYVRNEGRALNVDPARLPNLNFIHKDKVAFVNVDAKLNYSNGQMTGLFQGRRYYDCAPPRRDFGNITLNCTLTFDKIGFSYKLDYKYGQLPSSKGLATANLTTTYAFIEVTTSSYRNVPHLRNIHITQTGNVNLKYTVSLGDKVKKAASTEFAGRLRNEFYNVFTYNYKRALEISVSRVPMPTV